jgi:hypothetical protein
MRRLLAALDAKVGKGEYVLAMTADHGVCPLPENSLGQGRTAERVQPATAAKVEKFLTGKFGTGKEKWVEAISGPWIYLRSKTIKEMGVPQSDVEKALAGWLIEQPGVESAYTRTMLTTPGAKLDPQGQMVTRCFYPDRCGDVYVLLRPYCLSSAATGTGTTHGTPWEYDTHVPLLVYGTGVEPGVRDVRVTPLAAAVILAKAAGIAPPAGATVPVPEGLFAPAKPR